MQDVEWTRQAKADLAKLNYSEADLIDRAVGQFVKTGLGDVRQVKGGDPTCHRIKVGSWRVMLEFEAAVARVLRVLHRRAAYRKSARIYQEVAEAQSTQAMGSSANPLDLGDPTPESR